MARLYLGMSGWGYPEWRGLFYPDRLPATRMLGYYAEQFPSVEVNNTFYRLPQPEAIAGWRDEVPERFRFAFKAHRGITHRKRFADSSDILDRFADLLGHAGTRLGPVLFQFDTIADVPQLADFLGLAKARFTQIVAEFRHPSWLTEATFEVLRRAEVAMCQTETDEGSDPAAGGGTFSYLRLRKSGYTATDVEQRLRLLEELSVGSEVFAYWKHDAANAVLLREALMARR